MPGDLDGGTPRPFRGFSNYADDTPRVGQDELPLGDAFDEPEFDVFEPARGELTYIPREVWDGAAPRPRRYGGAIAAVLTVALATGAGFMLTRGWTPNAPQQERPAAPAPPSQAQEPPALDLAEARATPPPAANRPAKAPRSARQASAPLRTAEVEAPVPRFVDSGLSSDASANLPAPTVAVPVTPPDPIRPSFDCQGARSPAQRMVCSDPRLAAADRRMSRAYAAALAVGGSDAQLRSEQSDWLEIREDAARYSNRAVLNIYEQRTRELEAIAEEHPE
ncbi:MAG: lysozyme inhibitor LprI family protein [Phenylobacterium sp.]